MGLQSILAHNSSVFLMSIFNIIGMMEKRQNILNDVFAKYFTNPTTEANWYKIQSVIEPHVLKQLLPTGSTPSKPDRQLDGSFSPIRIQKLASDIAAMYDQANSLGILLNPSEMQYYFDETIDSIQNQEAFMRWDAILTAYNVLLNMNEAVSLIIEAIKPIYRSSSNRILTPAQLWFHGDEFMHGSLVTNDGLVIVPWQTIDQFKTDNDLNLGIVDVILRYDYHKLWYINIPTVTFGSGSDTFSVSDADRFVVLTPASGLPFAVENSFAASPPDPAPICTFANEYYNSNVVKFLIVPIGGGSDAGTITSTYKTLIVS